MCMQPTRERVSRLRPSELSSWQRNCIMTKNMSVSCSTPIKSIPVTFVYFSSWNAIQSQVSKLCKFICLRAVMNRWLKIFYLTGSLVLNFSTLGQIPQKLWDFWNAAAFVDQDLLQVGYLSCHTATHKNVTHSNKYFMTKTFKWWKSN